MKNRILFLSILIVSIPQLFSQNPNVPANTTDRIIEGGNLIVEILKVININENDKAKSSRSTDADCATKNFTNVCFVNKSQHIIIVKMKMKNVEEVHELIIINNEKECCYRIKPGVYEYSIQQKDEGISGTQLIRKGEILLEVCKNLEIKIK